MKILTPKKTLYRLFCVQALLLFTSINLYSCKQEISKSTMTILTTKQAKEMFENSIWISDFDRNNIKSNLSKHGHKWDENVGIGRKGWEVNHKYYSENQVYEFRNGQIDERHPGETLYEVVNVDGNEVHILESKYSDTWKKYEYKLFVYRVITPTRIEKGPVHNVDDNKVVDWDYEVETSINFFLNKLPEDEMEDFLAQHKAYEDAQKQIEKEVQKQELISNQIKDTSEDDSEPLTPIEALGVQFLDRYDNRTFINKVLAEQLGQEFAYNNRIEFDQREAKFFQGGSLMQAEKVEVLFQDGLIQFNITYVENISEAVWTFKPVDDTLHQVGTKTVINGEITMDHYDESNAMAIFVEHNQ